MIEIKTSDVREFFKRSRHIKTNGIMPCLGYIKIECKNNAITFYKTNLVSFCQHNLNGVVDGSHTLLVEEKALLGLVNSIKGETIFISYEDKKPPEDAKHIKHIRVVTMTDGKTKLSFQTEDESIYPSFPESNSNKEIYPLNEDFLRSILIASDYTEKKNQNQYSQVYVSAIGDGCEVFASNGFLLYTKLFGFKSANFQLSDEACNLIGGYSQVNYYRVGNHDFFDTGNTLYGFVDPDYKCPNYRPFLDDTAVTGKYTIDRRELLNYCELTHGATPSPIKRSTISDAGENGVLVSFNDIDFSVSNVREFESEKSAQVETFDFNTGHMLSLLKSLPYDSLTFNQGFSNRYMITSEDKNYKGIIMKLVTI